MSGRAATTDGRRLTRRALSGGRKLICYGSGSWQVMHPDSRVRIHVIKPGGADSAPPSTGKPWRVLAPKTDDPLCLESRGDFRTLAEAASVASKAFARLDAIARLSGWDGWSWMP